MSDGHLPTRRPVRLLVWWCGSDEGLVLHVDDEEMRLVSAELGSAAGLIGHPHCEEASWPPPGPGVWWLDGTLVDVATETGAAQLLAPWWLEGAWRRAGDDELLSLRPDAPRGPRVLLEA